METLPNHIIFTEAESALHEGKQVKIRIAGKSMEPFSTDNKDIVRIIPFISGRLNRADIVLFKVGKHYCLHRIIHISKESITLRGDGICQSIEIISPKDVIGVLHSVVRQSGNIITCNSIAWRVKSYTWMALFPIRKYLLFIYRRWNHIKYHLTIK